MVVSLRIAGQIIIEKIGELSDKLCGMTKETGFLLTAEALDIQGRCELRLYGTGNHGPFLIIVAPHSPLFFVKRECPAEYTRAFERKEVNLKNFRDSPVDAVYFNSLESFFRGRRALQEGGSPSTNRT